LDYVDELEMDELQSLYYLSGHSVHQYIKLKKSKCSTCLKAIKTSSSDETISQLKILTECKVYSANITARISFLIFSGVLELLRRAEMHFRKYASKLIQSETAFATCHNVAYDLLNIYFKSRIYFLLRKK
jgi:hypothetical protein